MNGRLVLCAVLAVVLATAACGSIERFDGRLADCLAGDGDGFEDGHAVLFVDTTVSPAVASVGRRTVESDPDFELVESTSFTDDGEVIVIEVEEERESHSLDLTRGPDSMDGRWRVQRNGAVVAAAMDCAVSFAL